MNRWLALIVFAAAGCSSAAGPAPSAETADVPASAPEAPTPPTPPEPPTPATAPVPPASRPSRAPAAIQTEGVPEIAPEVFERLRQYQNFRGAGVEGWAPDGQSLLVSTRFASTAQLHRVYAPGGRREQLTFFDEPVGGGRFLPDGSVFLSMARGGDEMHQLYRLDLADGRARLLTDGRSRHELGALNRAKTKAVVGVNAPGARDVDLYLLDLASGSLELLLATNGQQWAAADWSPDDTRIALEHYVSATESSIHVMELATRSLTPVLPPGGGKASVEGARFTGDGRALYVSSDAAGEFHTLARVDLATMEHTWLTSSIPWDVNSIEVSRDGSRVAFTTNEDGASRVYLLEDGRPRPVDVPLGIVGGLEFSPDAARLAMTISRPDAPADVYVLGDDGLVRWTFSEVGGLDASKFVSAQRISWTSFDGRTIPGYVTRPAKSGRVPVLIDIHGGPEGQSRPHFSGATQFLVNELGIAVIHPNVRGSSGYGKTYSALDNAEKREDSVKDIGALLDWIAKDPALDASRVAVTGGSYGGYMSLASLVHFGDRIRAGIDVVGIANFATFLRNTSAYRQDLRRAEYGDERDPAIAATFERISPANHAQKIRSALLVAHGVNDPRVPFSEARQIAEKVRSAGGRVWTVYASNEGHGFQKKENRDFLNAVTVRFLEENLLGGGAGSR
jgi:dipeptidyl aminopeptidase/acylaminoacyl peptidase